VSLKQKLVELWKGVISAKQQKKAFTTAKSGGVGRVSGTISLATALPIWRDVVVTQSLIQGGQVIQDFNDNTGYHTGNDWMERTTTAKECIRDA